MISIARLQAMFGDLSQNTTPENLTRAAYLANIEHKYLMQKFFANEGSYNINTIGQTTLTLAAAVPIGSTSITLASAWQYQTTQAQLTFSDGEVVLGNFTNGSTSVTWQPATQGLMYLLTASLLAGATSATLQSAWTGTSTAYLTSFSDGSTKVVTYTNGSTAISWIGGLAGAQGNQIFTSTIASGSKATIGGVQFYPFPPNYSKLKDLTITVGVLKWTLTEIRSREEWDNLNVFPYYASIPSKFFIYPGGDKGGQVGIWPIPSSTGNVIGYNYKFRVPDLSLPDYGSLTYSALVGSLTIGDTITAGAVTGIIESFTATNISIGNVSGTFAAGAFTTGNGSSGTLGAVATVSVTQGSTAVTGTSTAFVPTVNQQLESRWIQFAQPTGDGLWYQIQNISSTTGITLYQPYQGTTITTATGFTIGQMPLIAEDFQDLPLWKSLQQYFTSIVEKENLAGEYKDMYDRKIALLSEYSGSNTTNVNLSRRRTRGNPNLYGQTFGQTP
jgi:hypothetical protein